MSEFVWHPPAVAFAEEWGIPTEVVESAAANPTRTTLNEDSGKDGYVIEDRRRGDVTVVVGLRQEPPSILYVKVHTDQDFGPHRGGNAGGSAAPKTMRGVRARILADGYKISLGGGHEKVVTTDGGFLCALPISPSDHRTVQNVWSTYRRARDKHRLPERIAAGNLLGEAS